VAFAALWCRNRCRRRCAISNQEVAALLEDIADLLEVKNENQFRVRAYREAARTIGGMTEDVLKLWEEGRLREIPGVGPSIASKIDEFLRTGRLQYYEELRAQTPVGFTQLLSVPGLGPRRAEILRQKLGVTTLAQLEEALREHRVRGLPGFGEKVEENLLREIERLPQRQRRLLLGVALPAAEEVISLLRGHPAVARISEAGSIRRRVETIGDIDILVASDRPLEVMDAFTTLPIVKETLAKGPTKSSVLTKSNLQIDLRVVRIQEYGSALQYFTGSKSHNIALRDIAIAKGYKLSEYGLFEADTGRVIAQETEDQIYLALGLEPIPPELRENRGELEAAARRELPDLVQLSDICGDLQVHSDWSDGHNSVEEMARAAKDLGLEYIAMTDHSQGLGVAGGLTPERVVEQGALIRDLNRRLAPFRILHGAEVDIRADGSLDYDDTVLRQLDYICISVHNAFGQSRERMTQRVAKALQHPLVHALNHPTGRLIGRRRGYDLDLEEIIRVAAEHGKALEINAQPDRLDLDDVWARRAKEAGVPLVISTDAHELGHLDFMRYGVFVARRGWAEKGDVLNTRSLKSLEAWLHQRRKAA